MRLPLLVPGVLLASALLAGPAHAAKGERRVALLLDPAQLTQPRAELTVDIRLAPQTSLAGIIGVDLSSPLGVHHFGGQLRQTFTGGWERGAFLGAEAVTGDGSFTHKSDRGVAFGAFVGGRYTFSPALTLEGAVGGRLHLLNEKLYPGVLVNLGLGWSF